MIKSRKTVGFDTPVIRTVERMEHPSERAEITAARLAESNRFMTYYAISALACQENDCCREYFLI